MVANILPSSKSLTKALFYNFNKVDKELASVLGVANLEERESYHALSVRQNMELLIPNQCRTKNRVFHCSLNPDPKEKLSDEEFVAVADEYMYLLGYGKQPYIIFKHNDIEREHIHIVSLRVDSEGKKISDQFEYKRSSWAVEQLERKFDLIPNSPKYQALGTLAGDSDLIHEGIVRDLKANMDEVLSNYSFQTLGELNALLRSYQMKVEMTEYEYQGKVFPGMVYLATDDMGAVCSPSIKSHHLGKAYGLWSLSQYMRRSKEPVSEHLPNLRDRVSQALQSSGGSLNKMEGLLRAESIDLCLRRTDKGRIYGVTFIDRENHIVANGSRLGKEFSANAFNRYEEQSYKSYSQEPVSELASLTGLINNNLTEDQFNEMVWRKKLQRQNELKTKGPKR